MKKTIDINADIGEGTGCDEQLMPFLSSCNIACGGHYGDEASMLSTIRLAKTYKVKVGAHPSYPDKSSFGRKVLDISPEDLTQSVVKQLQDFCTLCEAENIPIHHIKPHGALYNYAAKDIATAGAVVEAIEKMKIAAQLYAPYGSTIHKVAEGKIPLVFEAFIDRKYQKDASLVPRNSINALIEDEEVAWEQLYNMVVNSKATTNDGDKVHIHATTFCIHGDHKNSVGILKYIHQQLKKHSISIK